MMNKRIKKKKAKQQKIARQKLYVALMETTKDTAFRLGECLISFTKEYASALAEKILSELFSEEKEQ
nr:MAG TPA: hypothetical protein [Caudoviricetes sp.]